MIRLPPAEPAIRKVVVPFGYVIIAGVQEERGRLPGRMKLLSEGM
jgi:hypothetical protein